MPDQLLENSINLYLINSPMLPGLKKNDDGSLTIYIGPKAPEGKEANWLATVPGRGFFAILRLYGPGEEAINYSWKPGDFEKSE